VDIPLNYIEIDLDVKVYLLDIVSIVKDLKG